MVGQESALKCLAFGRGRSTSRLTRPIRSWSLAHTTGGRRGWCGSCSSVRGGRSIRSLRGAGLGAARASANPRSCSITGLLDRGTFISNPYANRIRICNKSPSSLSSSSSTSTSSSTSSYSYSPELDSSSMSTTPLWTTVWLVRQSVVDGW